MCVFNFTPAPRDGYRIGVPGPELLQVVLNTDAAVFGGSDAGNVGLLKPEPTPWQGQPYSVALPLPPLAALYLRPVPNA